jgi:coenzyme F420-0:L-glutamate ligase / coenzyme F420-1:gamma-L-glutamate ligase
MAKRSPHPKKRNQASCAASPLNLFVIPGLPEIRRNDNLPELIAIAARKEGIAFEQNDILVVAQKIISKSEGRIVHLSKIKPSVKSQVLAKKLGNDSRLIELILRESRRIVRADRVLIVETHHGFVCANAGVDLSNVGAGQAALLPVDPDRSARHIRDALRARAGVQVAVIISDTFGRPWRSGLTDVAIGCAGIAAVVDLRGTKDATGRELAVTEVCVVDELAAAAELAKGKSTAVPVVIVRGIDRSWFRESSVRAEVVRSHQADLFR